MIKLIASYFDNQLIVLRNEKAKYQNSPTNSFQMGVFLVSSVLDDCKTENLWVVDLEYVTSGFGKHFMDQTTNRYQKMIVKLINVENKCNKNVGWYLYFY